MKARVSVLVTFYNQEKYVEKALSSVINQKTDFGIKVLVGDDGSSDGTQEIVKEWIKKYPDQIELYVMDRTPGKHISGFRASRNRLNLLKHVDTEYFIYLDGDDYYEYDEKLQRQVEILDDPKNSDCIACGHNMDMLYPDGKRVPITSTQIKEGKFGPKEYWYNVYFHTDTLLTRSSVIPSLDFNLLENEFNDNMITFSFIQQGNLYYIPKSWAVYLQTGDGIWTSGNEVVNLVRNMLLYDLCNRINSSMKKETFQRLGYVWGSLFDKRKQIDSSELCEYSKEAKEKQFNNAYKWIHYKELNIFQRQALCMKVLLTKAIRKYRK